MHVWRCGPCQGNCELQQSGNAVGCVCVVLLAEDELNACKENSNLK